MPLWTVTRGGCLGVEVMVIAHIWLSRRLLSPSYTTKWKISVTGWLPVSKEVMYLSGKRSHFKCKEVIVSCIVGCLIAADGYINVVWSLALELRYVLSKQYERLISIKRR